MTLLALAQPEAQTTPSRAVSRLTVVAEEEVRRMVLEALSELADAATPPPPIVRRRPAEIDYYSPVTVRGSRADSASGIPGLGAHRSERAWAL